MSINLIKLSVGVEDVEQLAEFQARRLADSARAGNPGRLWHRTRHTPRRGAELLDGGSIYWVIRRAIRARQPIVGFESETDEEGRERCLIMLGPALIETIPWPHRPFQGWRYLGLSDAPPDRRADDEAAGDELPPGMAAELRELGLL